MMENEGIFWYAIGTCRGITAALHDARGNICEWETIYDGSRHSTALDNGSGTLNSYSFVLISTNTTSFAEQ